MSYFGKASNEGLESLGAEEAISQMEQMESQGAVHTIWTMMTPFIGAICNCTLRDCLAMRSLSVSVETMARAEYAGVVDEERCTGCGECDRHCQFNAIRSIRKDGNSIAKINIHDCFGCGLCRISCGQSAISLMRR
jgi:Pyruvate/2-oxoacid:ferredoxin oxidoreductase delta subunit